jgi:nitronate monooxygenase
MKFPEIIQGGMGIGISGWALARAVSLRKQIGVVSATAIDLVLARRLQMGDPGGDMRRALAAFPDQAIAHRILNRYFIPEGKASDQPYKSKSLIGDKPNRRVLELLVAASFVEVWLAKEGHDGWVGVNFLHKIQTPLLASLYGAMLAGVDIVIVGAGIPLQIPKAIEALSNNQPAQLDLQMKPGPSGATHTLAFDPREVFDEPLPILSRPLFFPIVASVTLATMMLKKCKGAVDALIIEGSTAGGHNAPPRGKAPLNENGEPVYGPRDEINLEAIRALDTPFFLAGSYGSPQDIQRALREGAAGVQIGTLFSLTEESGLREDLKRKVIKSCQDGSAAIKTDPVASPTGFPFKVITIPCTLSENEVYAERLRRCDIGYLREPYEQDDGSIAWRCRADDPQDFARSGGDINESIGRKCLCNGLMANIGLGQVRKDGYEELPLVTCGDDLSGILAVTGADKSSYTSAEAIDYLLS